MERRSSPSRSPSSVVMTARLPAGSGQIICSRERTDHVLPTLMLDFTLTRGDDLDRFGAGTMKV